MSTDIDECMQAALIGIQLCPNQRICSNTNGDYACLCPTGTSLFGGVCVESKLLDDSAARSSTVLYKSCSLSRKLLPSEKH